MLLEPKLASPIPFAKPYMIRYCRHKKKKKSASQKLHLRVPPAGCIRRMPPALCAPAMLLMLSNLNYVDLVRILREQLSLDLGVFVTWI